MSGLGVMLIVPATGIITEGSAGMSGAAGSAVAGPVPGRPRELPVLLSVNVGMPKDVSWHGKTVYTGIWKEPVAGPRMVRRLDIDGDGQGDTAGTRRRAAGRARLPGPVL